MTKNNLNADHAPYVGGILPRYLPTFIMLQHPGYQNYFPREAMVPAMTLGNRVDVGPAWPRTIWEDPPNPNVSPVADAAQVVVLKV